MLVDILHKIAVDEVKEKDQDNYKYVPRPSNAGLERCMRQMVYHGLDYKKKPLAGRMLFVFDDGHWHEELVNDWIRKSAYKLHSEQMEVQITDSIKGHIDGIITDLSGKDILLEIKSMNHFTFSRYEKGDVFPLDYIAQVVLYLLGLAKHGITDALLFVKNKNTGQFLEYYITYNVAEDKAEILWLMSSTDCEKIEVNKTLENITATIFERFALIDKCIKEKEIPVRQYERSDWQCQYCRYGETCWEGWESEIESMESDVALSEEFGTLLGHRQEIAMHVSEMTKEKKQLDKEIKAKLKEKGIRQGKVDRYTVELSIVEKKAFSVEASKYEKLTIRLKKEEK